MLAQGPISAAAYNVLWELGVASQPQTGVKVIEKLVLLTFWSVPALDPRLTTFNSPDTVVFLLRRAWSRPNLVTEVPRQNTPRTKT